MGIKYFSRLLGFLSMGLNITPFFVNLFLYYHDNNWIQKIKKSMLEELLDLTGEFSVAHIPYLDSNAPSKMLYSTFGAEKNRW